MLDRDQVKKLRWLVHGHLGLDPNPQTLRDLLGEELAAQVPAVSVAFDRARWIVQRAVTAQDSKLLVLLIRETWTNEFQDLKDLADALTQDPSRWSQALGDPLLVRNGAPFIDRHSFKEQLPALLGPLDPDEPGQPRKPACMVVFGDKGSGKSYLNQYIESLRSDRPDLHTAFLQVGDLTEDDFDVVTSDAKMGLGIATSAPDDHPEPHRWAQNIANWLAFETPKRSVPGLLLIEHLDQPGLDDAFYTLVTHLLALLRDNPGCAERLRVVLLGVDIGRLEAAGLSWLSCSLEYVDQALVAGWFKERFPKLAPYHYDEAARKVDDAIPSSGRKRMRKLRAAVILVSPALAQVVPQEGD